MLADERSKGAASLRLSWMHALEGMPDIKTDWIKQIGLSCPGPKALRQFSQFLARESDATTALETFFKEVDESEESLEDWMEAFAVLANGLEATRYRPTLLMALGYLHCCEAVAHTGAQYETFPMTVETMLETYGYEGESDSGGA